MDIIWRWNGTSWILYSNNTPHYTSGEEVKKGYIWGLYFNVKMLSKSVENFLGGCRNITKIDYEFRNMTRKAIKAVRADGKEYIVVDVEYGGFP